MDNKILLSYLNLNGSYLRDNKIYKYLFFLLITYLSVKRIILPTTRESFVSYYKRIFYKYLLRFPKFKTKILESKKELHNNLMHIFKHQDFIQSLPLNNLTANQVLDKLQQYNSLNHISWDKGKMSGAIYLDYSNKDHLKLMKDVFASTAYSNPLHTDIFPGIRKMESEIVKMTINLYNGNENTVGTITSGGTESIILACKAYRDWARYEKNIRNPVMLIPVSAHAAFDKAAQLLDIEIKHIPIDSKTMKVNIKKMKKAINRNVCLLVGSSPNYPNGIIDPMDEIIDLGLAYNIPVHMDACLGGFLLPFLNEAGFQIFVTDFKKKGLTSISADTHKYAFAPKGTSVLLFSDSIYRHYQYFNISNWTGGIYATSTIAGSRAGNSIATCWATLLYFGKKYYVESTKKIIETAYYIKNQLNNCEGIFIYGDPMLSVIAIGSNKFNIFELNDELSKKGWCLNSIQNPNGFHICVTLMHTLPNIKEQLVNDIKECVHMFLSNENRSNKKGSQSAMYGMSNTIPDISFMDIFVNQYLDSYYSTKVNF